MSVSCGCCLDLSARFGSRLARWLDSARLPKQRLGSQVQRRSAVVMAAAGHENDRAACTHARKPTSQFVFRLYSYRLGEAQAA